MYAPYAFDASVFEVWVALAAGWQVFVAPDEEIGARSMRSLVTRAALTHVHVTAGLCRVLADADPGCFAGVREVLTGGGGVPGAAGQASAGGCPGAPWRA